jgi:hypothetical protein
MRKLISLITSFAASVSIGVVAGLVSSSARADQIVLQNGDMLNGKVLSMTTNALVLQDESLGTLTVPKAKVSNITFGTVAAARPPLVMANDAKAGSSAGAGSQDLTQNSDLQAMCREIRVHSNLVQQVEAQVLGSSASPEADAKFNELLDQLSSGQLDMNGLRAQAQSAVNQLNDYKKQMGPDAGEEVDSYLSILNTFLNDTAGTNGVAP